MVVESVAYASGYEAGVARVTDDEVFVGKRPTRDQVLNWFEPGQEAPADGLIAALCYGPELAEALDLSVEEVEAAEEEGIGFAFDRACADFNRGYRAGALAAAAGAEADAAPAVYIPPEVA